jgi:hypothetical protein
MISKRELDNAVSLIIEEHGEDAMRHAAGQVQVKFLQADMDGMASWSRVLESLVRR